MDNSINNKRIAKNTLMLYFRMILTMGVSLYTSRVVLNTLGITDFGIYNVVGGVVTLFSFLNGAMSSATQRFLSFEMGSNNLVQLRKTFNATQNIHVGIALLIFILAETVGLWFLENNLNIPKERMEAARLIYHTSVLGFMISVIQVPYNAIVIAREKMSIYAYISILEIFLKLISVFMLTWFFYDKLKLFGILLLITLFIIATIYIIYVRRNFPETAFLVVRDSVLYRTLISYSGWSLFGGTAMIAKGQGVSILLNIFFGTAVNAAQGIAQQVTGSLNSFVSSFQTASNPQIVKSYAGQEMVYMNSLVIRTAKFSFYLLFVLTLPILIEVEFVLTLWLKLVPKYTAYFTVLILINAWIDSISGPLITTVQATGKIKMYQVVVGTAFMLNLPLSFMLFKFGFSPISTFILNIGITAIVFIIRLMYTRSLVPHFSARQFITEVIIRNIPVVFCSTVFPYLIVINMDSSLTRFFLVLVLSIVTSFLTIYAIGFNAIERKFLLTGILSFINKIKTAK